MQVNIHGRVQYFRTVAFDHQNNKVRLIEQRLLPHEFRIIGTRDFRATARAIRDMVVRGAGAIGATAAYGLAQGAIAFRGRCMARFETHVLRLSLIHISEPTRQAESRMPSSA